MGYYEDSLDAAVQAASNAAQAARVNKPAIDAMAVQVGISAGVASDAQAAAAASASSASASATAAANSAALVGAPAGAAIDAAVRSGVTMDVRVGLKNDAWSLTAFARNLADERGQVAAYASGGQIRVSMIQPRTFAIQLARTF